jgi:hypothetical protein
VTLFQEPEMNASKWFVATALCVLVLLPARAEPPASVEKPQPGALVDYFPPPEDQGGWRSLLPSEGTPDAAQKAKIRDLAGVDWDKLATAWEFNTSAEGATGLLVIRRGQVVGEWYRDCDRTTAFNIYSSSKAYTSMAYGLILADFGAGKLPSGETLRSTRRCAMSAGCPNRCRCRTLARPRSRCGTF